MIDYQNWYMVAKRPYSIAHQKMWGDNGVANVLETSYCSSWTCQYVFFQTEYVTHFLSILRILQTTTLSTYSTNKLESKIGFPQTWVDVVKRWWAVRWWWWPSWVNGMLISILCKIIQTHDRNCRCVLHSWQVIHTQEQPTQYVHFDTQ